MPKLTNIQVRYTDCFVVPAPFTMTLAELRRLSGAGPCAAPCSMMILYVAVARCIERTSRRPELELLQIRVDADFDDGLWFSWPLDDLIVRYEWLRRPSSDTDKRVVQDKTQELLDRVRATLPETPDASELFELLATRLLSSFGDLGGVRPGRAILLPSPTSTLRVTTTHESRVLVHLGGLSMRPEQRPGAVHAPIGSAT